MRTLTLDVEFMVEFHSTWSLVWLSDHIFPTFLMPQETYLFRTCIQGLKNSFKKGDDEVEENCGHVILAGVTLKDFEL